MSHTLRVFGLFCLLGSAFSTLAQTTNPNASLIAAQVEKKPSSAPNPETKSSQEQPVTTTAEPESEAEPEAAAAPATTTTTTTAAAEIATLTGRVFNEENKPLAGVVVFIKDAAAFVSTDAKGEYRLDAPAGVHTLTFSYAGYEEQQLKASNFLPASVQLLPAANKKKLTKSSRH
ncbi:carboxypeptidase-like regulatory domain-containing protein [Hymenobacter cellulosivorans]|uniref:Carboxypeptidase-like regulatory domain-containing protein n=1 Tax=Hymenobacter cellulosivorans TaxID=2932249 RepID=A0ABY4F312_9BACT|nr:carboxypeptidase-like regulatory domain-containing protein [Hymenobacter cellulosivorans]UOQ51053.1 carboxypeptidase-like regulatory domain-containing protein [Hymenobacter cellulosivorans]